MIKHHGKKMFVGALLPAVVSAVLLIGQTSSAKTPVRIPQGAHLEVPAVSKGEIILTYLGFTVSYDTLRLIPKWVCYELTDSEVDGQTPRARSFSMDLDFKGPQAMREDYSHSGWDKGHMAPAADMKWSPQAMKESFYLTNVCPQDHSLNAGDWLELEKQVRIWAQQYSKLWVVCGPIIGEGRWGSIGERGVTVPDGFFKACLFYDNGSYRSLAFVFPNSQQQSHPLSYYLLSVNSLEAQTGIDFFPALPPSIEEMVESRCEMP